MPTEAAPISIKCTECNGDGCSECGGTGTVDITGCPMEFITDDVWEVIRFTEFFEKGLAPVAGGVLDQAYCFTESARFVLREKNYWENRLRYGNT